MSAKDSCIPVARAKATRAIAFSYTVLSIDPFSAPPHSSTAVLRVAIADSPSRASKPKCTPISWSITPSAVEALMLDAIKCATLGSLGSMKACASSSSVNSIVPPKARTASLGVACTWIGLYILPGPLIIWFRPSPIFLAPNLAVKTSSNPSGSTPAVSSSRAALENFFLVTLRDFLTVTTGFLPVLTGFPSTYATFPCSCPVGLLSLCSSPVPASRTSPLGIVDSCVLSWLSVGPLSSAVSVRTSCASFAWSSINKRFRSS